MQKKEHSGEIGMLPLTCYTPSFHLARRGYSGAMLEELCEHSGLKVERISYFSGYASQKVVAAMRRLSAMNALLAWALTLPLRVLPPLLDPIITVLLGWPYFSICLEAYKPRQFPERTFEVDCAKAVPRRLSIVVIVVAWK